MNGAAPHPRPFRSAVNARLLSDTGLKRLQSTSCEAARWGHSRAVRAFHPRRLCSPSVGAVEQPLAVNGRCALCPQPAVLLVSPASTRQEISRSHVYTRDNPVAVTLLRGEPLDMFCDAMASAQVWDSGTP
jgi:hypothetical protein